MKKRIYLLSLLLLHICPLNILSQESYKIPNAVKTELSRLDAAYDLLDLYANKIWDGWNDYLSYPINIKFPNGLEFMLNNPNLPKNFTLYKDLKIHGLEIFINTSNVKNQDFGLPFGFGGGVGTVVGRSPSIITFSLRENVLDDPLFLTAEFHILGFIHELLHFHQYKIVGSQYATLFINPDLNNALYSDIEGQALEKAYLQTSAENAIPYLKDFCIARRIKTKDFNQKDLIRYANREFFEGHATFAEWILLQLVKTQNTPNLKDDKDYHHFNNAGLLANLIFSNLKKSTENTLLRYSSIFYYEGCFQTIMLEKYYPGWQREIKSDKLLYQILIDKLQVSPEDSLLAIQRFRDLYQIDKLRYIHAKEIDERDSLANQFINKDRRYIIINTLPVVKSLSQFIGDSTLCFYNEVSGLRLYPDGLNEIRFDKVHISSISEPVELRDYCQLKVLHKDDHNHQKPLSIDYLNQDSTGNYLHAKISTNSFTLSAPKISISENKDSIIITVIEK